MTGTRHNEHVILAAILLILLGLGAFGDVLDSAGEGVISFSADKDEYVTWDRLRFYLELKGSSDGLSIDLYLAVMLPDGSLFGIVPDLSFSGLNVEKGRLYAISLDQPETLEPAISNLSVGDGTAIPRTLVYKATLSYGLSLPEGEYYVFAMACHAGTLTPVAFSSESFCYEPQNCTISGRIFDENGPASSATVRAAAGAGLLGATANEVLSDIEGNFCLEGVPCDKKIRITGWKPEYYCQYAKVMSPTTSAVLVLEPITPVDNEEYEWLAPDPTSLDQKFCINCHTAPYQQWVNNLHALAASNEIFQTLYTGCDVHGNPNKGPGYKLDFPNTAGSCALCHAPIAALKSPYSSDMSNLSGLGKRGVSCDFCHKIVDVDLSNLGTVYGINAIELRRPFPDRQLWFGPFNDSGPLDTFDPLMDKSELCAPCHACEFWGVPIYTSFPEWEASEYKQMEMQCQACHYRPDGVTTNVAPLPNKGRERDPDTIPSHLIMGEDNVGLHYESATLSITASAESNDRLVATVEVFNAFAGHHLPTGRPIRNIILLVEAFDCEGNELEFVGEQVVPIYGGTGGGPRDFAGRPGKLFAKILVDQDGNHPAPSWRQTMILSDSRIPALGSDFSTYGFLLPEGTTCATVEAQLIYRKIFKDMADEKGLQLDDILMTSETETFHFGGN